MRRPEGTEGSSAPGGAADLLGALIGGWTLWCDELASWRRGLGRSYDLRDAASDIDSFVSLWAASTLALTEAWWGVTVPLPRLGAGEWSTTMRVFSTVTHRPLSLRSDGLRAIGLGSATRIPQSAVTFEPTVLREGVDTFKVTVSFPGPAARKTLIYEGQVTAAEIDGPVTDPVRPNNRDSGPVE